MGQDVQPEKNLSFVGQYLWEKWSLLPTMALKIVPKFIAWKNVDPEEPFAINF